MVVVLGVALVACGALARRYPIAPAILLVLVGVLVGRLGLTAIGGVIVTLGVALAVLVRWATMPERAR